MDRELTDRDFQRNPELKKIAVKEGNGWVLRVDGFSRRSEAQPTVPNKIFFGGETAVDLDAELGTSRRQRDVFGLIDLFNRYKFTVDENTPVEEEVALDPELLGKVFENLLASYNEDTQSTARKQSGSFYTPREVVDYMVDEALVAYFERHLPDTAECAANLRQLLSYTAEGNPFDQADTVKLIAATESLKVLDPACGSGAFPMGVLAKLVHVLKKLDPDNALWRTQNRAPLEAKCQIALASKDLSRKESEIEEAEASLAKFDEDFADSRHADYTRKLYLIEKCIHGVDIQPIAVQIAKLRFFISLIVSQEVAPGKPNLGITALPNLETKIVAANSLVAIDRPAQMGLRDPNIDDLEKELAVVNEHYFGARTSRTKRKWRVKIFELREELARLLESDRFLPEGSARQLVHWNPFDQNAAADFFDPEWMFQITDGFDITIGNPPYVRADGSAEYLAQRRRLEESRQYQTLWEKWDLYIPFIERSYQLLKPDGVTTMIVSDAYCHAKYALKSQNWFLKNARILRLDFLSQVQIFDAAVRNITYLFQKADGQRNVPLRRLHEGEFGKVRLLPSTPQAEVTHRIFFPEDTETQTFTCATLRLNDICYISVGMVVHADEKVAQGQFEMDDLISERRDAKHPKPFVEGKHLDRWLPATHRWLEWGTARAPGMFRRPTFEELYDVPEKLISVDMAAGVGKLRVAYDNERLFHNHSAWSFVPWHTLSGIRNRSLQKVARYRDEKQRADLPRREDLEATSRRFAVKYLLGVMNSSTARDFLRAHRRSNIHLYPDDWKQLPIPDIDEKQQAAVIALVERILTSRSADPATNITALEAELDQAVARLYGVAI
ncbi:MAG: Eco57I restriction-modification methylase domain-containing protein [Bryobacterales bacterium]|nr:Eco57I restriction-modification methylase domain-containing protein [Bryobacterales bacterium]